VIYIDDGRAIDRGSHSELYTRLEAYRDLIDAYEQQEDS